MQLETIQNLAMVPVRGTVFVVKLPFVCVWKVVLFLFSCVYAVVLSIVRVPAYYVKKACNRLSITWNWTKLSVKQSLGFSSKTPAAIVDGTQTPYPRDYLSDPVSGHPAQLALRDDDPFLDTQYGPHSRRRGRKSSRRERKAMITQLLRLLLEPSSPMESDEESERASVVRSAPEQDEAEKALRLILDLVKLSKSQEPVSGGKRNAPALEPEELEAILSRARDREQLQAMISELDQLAIEVEPDKVLKKPVGTGSSGHPSPSPSHTLVDSDRPSSTCSMEPVYTPNPSSIVSSSDEGTDPVDDDEHFHDVQEHPGSFERPPYKHGTLSPVQESPEYLTASSESLKLSQLEDELKKALSTLSTATSELEADHELVESIETEITQKTVTVTETVVRDSDLESVPKTTPSLGVQVGHERRDLAIARKPRPPSRKAGPAQSQQSPPDQKEDNNREGDPTSDSSESDDDELSKGQAKGERKRTVPTKLLLTDQIHLLTSNTPISPGPVDVDEDEAEDDDPSSQTDGPKGSSSDSKDAAKDTQCSKEDSNSSEADTMKLSSSQPLWMEMRRKRTDSSSSSVGTPTSTGFPVVVYTPPPRKGRALSDPRSDALQQKDGKKEGNIWDNDPALDNQENLYDTLAPKPDGLVRPVPAEPLYLHERIALRKASGAEPSPRLPPRNTSAMKRTSSAETVSKPEKRLERRGSERQSSTSRSRMKDKESQEKSRDRERSRDHHERSRDRSKEHREQSRDSSRDHHERSSSRDHHERSRDSSKEHRSRDGSRDHERSRDSSRDHHERSSSKEHRERSRDGHRERSRDGNKERRERAREIDRPRDREAHKSSQRDESMRESRSREKESHLSRSRERERRMYRSHSAERSRSRSEHRHSSDRAHHRSRSGDRSSSHSTERHSSSHRHSSSDRRRNYSSRNSSSATSSPDSKSSKEGDPKSKTLASPFSSKSKLAAFFSRSSTKDSPKEEKQKKASPTGKEKKLSSKSRSDTSRSSEKTSSRTKCSPEKDEPTGAGRVVYSASMSSLRSADVGSVYSFDSAISKNNA